MNDWSDRDQLLYKIARAYYADDQTQQLIADRFGISRVKVCRMLKQARDEGMVSISIRGPSGGTADLERRLEERYDIQEALVVDTSEDPNAAGVAAAAYFSRIVHDGLTVTLSWGASLLSFVNALEPLTDADVRVVQMLGGLGDAGADVHGADLARRMAQRLGSRPRLLQAPGIVTTKAVRSALMADQQIAETLDLARKADVAFVGIGALDADNVLRGGSIISATELATLSKAGAVGDLALNFFGPDGQSIHSDTDERVIGLSLDEIKAIPRVVALAWGSRKVTPLRGALAGKFIAVLITDTAAAEGLLGQ
jgi:DNA-binding transcriptional regulator LsrR (DeoR family)